MATLAKQEMVAALNEKFSKAAGVVQAEYRGIDADTMTALRADLRAEQVELYVVKNRLAKIAAKGTPVEELSEGFTGPTSLAISYDNSTAPARLLSDFAQKEKLLNIIAGMAEGDVFDAAGVKAIGKLPAKPVLLSSYLSVMQGPTRSFVYVISGVLKQFLYLLNAAKEQRESNPDFKGEDEMADVSAEDVKSYLNSLSVLKLVELTKELEEEWGVSAAAPVAVAAAPAAGGGEAAAEEKTSFTVNLTAAGDKKIQVIKAVREATGLGLKEAKEIVDSAPKAVKENVAKDEAEELKKKLEEAGATVELA